MKICIVGDSWGCGEWGRLNDKYMVLHKGVEEYLSAKHEVDNYASGATSNNYAYNKLLDAANVNYDLILFFQTDPYRDYNKEQLVESFASYDLFQKRHQEALYKHYERVNALGKTIHLIGGCTKVHATDVNPYTNLKVFIPSIIEWLCPNLKQPEVWCGRWYKLMNMKTDRRIIDMVYENRKLQEQLDSPDNPCAMKYFQPDGGHANRYAHYEIYKKIISELAVPTGVEPVSPA